MTVRLPQPGVATAVAAVLMAALAGSPLTLPSVAQSPPSQESVRGGMFDASDPAGLQDFLTRKGYVATLGADPAGPPVIRGRISRTDYAMLFYECEDGRFCNSVQFVADAPAPDVVDFERLNAFNLRWRYVRAARLGDTVRLLLDLNLDAGVTAANLEDTLDIWRQLVEVFERELVPPAAYGPPSVPGSAARSN